MKLRLRISAEDYDRLRAAFFSADAQDIKKSSCLSVYLDTPEAALHEHGLIWCFSRKDKIRDGKPIKAGDWRPDRDSGARSFVKKHKLFNRLGGVFTLREESERVLQHAAQSTVEISLVRARFHHGEHSTVSWEVEFASIDGPAEELTNFVTGILPHAEPDHVSHVERGYQLAGLLASEPAATEPVESEASAQHKTMQAADVFKQFAQTEIARALAAPLPIDAAGLCQSLLTAQRFQSLLHIAANMTLEVFGDDQLFTEWSAALQKLHDLDIVLTTYLKPAAQRGRWDMAANLVARVQESRDRSFAALAQAWPETRIKNRLMALSEKLASLSVSPDAGFEPLARIIASELAKAADEIQTRGQALQDAIKLGGSGKSRSEPLLQLRFVVSRLQHISAFFEPFMKGKSVKRASAFQSALEDFKRLLEKEYHLNYAQALVADTAAHIARLKQTKTQHAQTYAAGALAGFLEALKADKPEAALKSALADLSDIKPFWTKID